MLLMRATSVTRASGRGVGPWKLRLYWDLWNGIKPKGECHLGPQKVEISRAQPPPTCPTNGCCPHQKHYAQGRINHRCIVVLCTRAQGWFQGPCHPLTRPPITLRLRLLCVYPFDSAPSQSTLWLGPPLLLPLWLGPLHSPPPQLEGGGGGGGGVKKI